MTQGPYLPPVGVILVDDLEEVSGNELQPGFLTWNEVVRGWVIVKVGLHKHLRKGKQGEMSREALEWERRLRRTDPRGVDIMSQLRLKPSGLAGHGRLWH